MRRSPAAPRRQATASGLGWNRSPQPAATAASAPTTRPSRGTSRLPRTPPPAPIPRMAATRQGRVRVQAAHSAARIRRHLAWAEPPGRPTLARTRTATTGRSAPVPASSWSGSSPRWARMACRSAWLSGRTDPLGRSSSSSKGQGRELAIGCSFLVLANPVCGFQLVRRSANRSEPRPVAGTDTARVWLSSLRSQRDHRVPGVAGPDPLGVVAARSAGRSPSRSGAVCGQPGRRPLPPAALGRWVGPAATRLDRQQLGQCGLP